MLKQDYYDIKPISFFFLFITFLISQNNINYECYTVHNFII
jgi:hypothetical protein